MKFTRTPPPAMLTVMKTFFKHPIAAVLVLLLSTGCFRNDIRTETFQIEQLRSQEGAVLLSQALQPIAGILEIRPDFEARRLTVIFNGREAYLKNIEYAIVKAGFDLPHWPAKAADKEKLPENLRK